MTEKATTNVDSPKQRARLIPHDVLWPFILLSSCFAWWGLANNMTDPLVKAFTGIFKDLSNFRSALIQFAFYGAYFCLAIPGSIIARRYSYKHGVLIGLGLYIVGCFLFYPASQARVFIFFLLSFYVLAGGLSILETNANPFILSLGSEATATQRLNLAQSFNPLGSVIGTLMCQGFILAKLEKIKESGSALAPDQLQSQQLSIVIAPYLAVGFVLIAIWLAIAFTKMPLVKDTNHSVHFLATFKRLFRTPNYVFAVIAQFFYVGAQICVWTFTVYYIPKELGISSSQALRYHTVALILFGVSRFISTWLMSFIKPHTLLTLMAVLGGGLTCLVIFVGGYIGVYSLIAISACMSLMFPTIFGLGSRGLGEDRKVGGAGLIMAILGGAILTPLQAKILDLSNVNWSYCIPLICFIVITCYSIYAGKVKIPENNGPAT